VNTIPSAAVRASAVAGTWYPGGRADLRKMVEGYLESVADGDLPGRPIAVVSPHAGYLYSGPTAAHSYAPLRGRGIRRVVLMGPLHRPVWGGAPGSYCVPAEAAFRTPLGDVAVDHGYAERLAQYAPLTAVRGDEEHSLEIQLPFLQVVLGDFALVPVMIADDIADPTAVGRLEKLSVGMAALWDAETVLVASTDLSHLHSHADVTRTDAALLALVRSFDVDGLAAALAAGSVNACGATALVSVMRAAMALGARDARVLAYATSGDVTGDKRPGTYTVGYMAAAFCG